MGPPAFFLYCREAGEQRRQSYLEAVSKLSMARGIPQRGSQIGGASIHLSREFWLNLTNFSFEMEKGQGGCCPWPEKSTDFAQTELGERHCWLFALRTVAENAILGP